MRMTKWVYVFGDGQAEGSAQDNHLLGGKGANLAEMCSLGLPVPPGLTITTEACNAYYESGKSFPDGLEADVMTALEKVGAMAGRENPPILQLYERGRGRKERLMDCEGFLRSGHRYVAHLIPLRVEAMWKL